ncbi:hypothetical protein Bbelb_376000 [Branchiostoma belcheri]|nr:hypothetical protein Bbelb_376000 [Branchiostoma belcheri]
MRILEGLKKDGTSLRTLHPRPPVGLSGGPGRLIGPSTVGTRYKSITARSGKWNPNDGPTPLASQTMFLRNSVIESPSGRPVGGYVGVSARVALCSGRDGSGSGPWLTCPPRLSAAVGPVKSPAAARGTLRKHRGTTRQARPAGIHRPTR